MTVSQPVPIVRDLIAAIVRGDSDAALRMIDAAPSLASDRLREGATRQNPQAHFIPALACYLYEGDTALHVAAAAWRTDLIARLVAAGADVGARNRRGATALHYAAGGDPTAERWDPAAQAAAIGALVAAGANPNATDGNGSTPLHRAVRNRCAAATQALIEGGGDLALRTRSGSTLATLAIASSGRGGSGSPQARAQQARILELLDAPRPGRTPAV